MASALNSGNLTNAQQAYAALNALQNSGQGSPGNSNNPLSQALSQIGQALQNGDLTGAQQALSSLQQSHSHHSHGHHHHAGGGNSVNNQATSATSNATTDSSTVPGTNAVNIIA